MGNKENAQRRNSVSWYLDRLENAKTAIQNFSDGIDGKIIDVDLYCATDGARIHIYAESAQDVIAAVHPLEPKFSNPRKSCSFEYSVCDWEAVASNGVSFFGIVDSSKMNLN